MKLGVLIVAVACAGGCSGQAAQSVVFGADYRSSYTEVRNCRASADHDLDYIRVLASPTALDPYRNRQTDFPIDAVVLKEQYDPADSTCSGPITLWTVMRRVPTGSSPSTLDWQWQQVSPDRHVTQENGIGCISCHTNCGKPPDGFQGTCAQP